MRNLRTAFIATLLLATAAPGVGMALDIIPADAELCITAFGVFLIGVMVSAVVISTEHYTS